MMRRVAYISLGSVATGLAIVGVWLPGLPTTPFLLVALWAFANSSERLHAWLMRVPLLQTALAEARRFEEQRAVRREVKVFAQAVAWGSAALVIASTGAANMVLNAVMIAAGVSCSLFMWSVKTARD
jgi:hypothetical protein